MEPVSMPEASMDPLLCTGLLEVDQFKSFDVCWIMELMPRYRHGLGLGMLEGEEVDKLLCIGLQKVGTMT
jgi:hypothetical protein